MTTAIVETIPQPRASRPDDAHSQRTVAPPPKGWRPAHDDDTYGAVAWRSKTALRLSKQNTRTLKKLTSAVEALTSMQEASNTAWTERWATVSRIAWGVGLPVLVTGVIAALAFVGRWVSTLHH